MKTRIGKTIIDWEEHFDHGSSVREITYDFAENKISGRCWVNSMWPKSSKKVAQQLIRNFGVKGARLRAKRFLRNHTYNFFRQKKKIHINLL